MAGPRTRRNAGEAFTNDSDTPVFTPAVSYASTPTPAQTSVPAEAPAPAQAFDPIFASASASIPGPPKRYTDKNLQRATKLAQKLFVKRQEYSQLQVNTALCNCSLKAQNSDLYYKSLYIKCYYFC